MTCIKTQIRALLYNKADTTVPNIIIVEDCYFKVTIANVRPNLTIVIVEG